MESVGYDMYLKLLSEAVAEEKGEKAEDEQEAECLIDLPIEAHIPEDYITSTPQRLSIYKRIAAIRSDADANDVYDELGDRFGAPPEAICGLVEIALLRNIASKIGVYEITQRNGSVLFYMNEPDIKYVVALNKEMKGRVLLSAAKKAYIAVKLDYESSLETVQQTLAVMNAVFSEEK